MEKIDLQIELEKLGLNRNEYSLRLSHPNAFYHFQMGTGLNWEVFYKNERDGTILFKRQFKDEERAKEYLIDLVRVRRGKKAFFNIIDTPDEFYREKEMLLTHLNITISESEPNDVLLEFRNLLSNLKMDDNTSKQEFEQFLLANAFTIGEELYQKAFFFLSSIPDSL